MACELTPAAERPRYYLPDGSGYRVASLWEWAAWYEDRETCARPFREGGQRVGRDELSPDAYVSTVFLGLDHAMPCEDGPLLFETMVVGGPHDGEGERYTTLAEAEAGHAAHVARCRETTTTEAK